MARKCTSNTDRPHLESLEPRRMMSAAPAIALDGLSAVVEVGQVSVDHQAADIFLSRSFANPVVIVNRQNPLGIDRAVLRVSNVQSEQFTVQFVETSTGDGLHALETVSYMVIEAGRWSTPEGTIIEAGTVNTAATVNGDVDPGDPNWTPVTFLTPFAGYPTILTQIQTANDATPSNAFVTTRQTNRKRAGFEVSMEHAQSVTGMHASESIGFLAIASTWGTWDGYHFGARYSGPRVTSAGRSVSYGGWFQTRPQVWTSMGSYLDADNAVMGNSRPRLRGIGVHSDEDSTADGEVIHAAERVDLLSMDTMSGLLNVNRVDTSQTTRRVYAGSVYRAHVTELDIVGYSEDLVGFKLKITNISGDSSKAPDTFDSVSHPFYTGITGQLHQHESTVLQDYSQTLDGGFATAIDSHFLTYDANLLNVVPPTEDSGVSASSEVPDAAFPLDAFGETSFGSSMGGAFADSSKTGFNGIELAYLVVPRGTEVSFNALVTGPGGGEVMLFSFFA